MERNNAETYDKKTKTFVKISRARASPGHYPQARKKGSKPNSKEIDQREYVSELYYYYFDDYKDRASAEARWGYSTGTGFAPCPQKGGWRT